MRKSAGDARHYQRLPEAHRFGISEQDAAGGSKSMADGRDPLFWPGRRISHGVSLSPDAADVHGGEACGPQAHHLHLWADAPHTAHLPVVDLSAQSSGTYAGDGEGHDTRLHLR